MPDFRCMGRLKTLVLTICFLIASIPLSAVAEEKTEPQSEDAFPVDPVWEKQAAEDARQDRTAIVFDGAARTDLLATPRFA